ncbi:MAG: hypothetical protein ACI4UE_06185 [Candidatus Scatovivens sp.]
MGYFWENYEEAKKNLIEKGAEEKLFEMPSIRERLEKLNIRVEDVIVNEDGTFNFGAYRIKKVNLENGGSFAIQTTSEKEDNTHYVMDDPLWLEEKSQAYLTTAQVTYINEEGIEIETKIKEKYGHNECADVDFEDIKAPLKRVYIRENGIITERDQNGREVKFYDNGHWSILDGDDALCSFGTIEGDKISRTISIFDSNTQELVTKYPNLQQSSEQRRKELLRRIDERTESVVAENQKLKSDNERLQQMLKKALSFAETVRNSSIGKLFFGRKAKELLGEKNKDAKQLSEGRE